MNFQYPDTVLLIFAKAPEPGKVKTRLISVLGKEAACEFYSKMASDIISRLTDSMLCPIVLYCYPDTIHIFFKKHEQKFNLELKRQEGIDLGERMFNAFEFVFNQKNRQAIIVGTDIPDLSKEIILGAIDSLDKNDLVIGPSHDGGYYLLGMKKVHSGLFEDIEWSSNSVFSSTVQKANASNLKIKELQMLRDIDTKNELDNWLLQAGNMELKNKILSLLKKQNLNDH